MGSEAAWTLLRGRRQFVEGSGSVEALSWGLFPEVIAGGDVERMINLAGF